jgi:predicted metalloenzyme YecM
VLPNTKITVFHDFIINQEQLVTSINLQLWQIYHDHICCNTSYNGKGDGEDKDRANEANGAAMATKATTTQEQRPP